MIVLALDTTTRAGSVAVVIGQHIVLEIAGDAALTHGQRLPGELMRALDATSLMPDDLDLLAVAAGPGSFTGLRVGIAAMQGLAVATGHRIVPVSTLDALARSASPEANGRSIATWMDAQRGQVFAALYDSGARHLVIEPSVGRPDVILDMWDRVTVLSSLRFTGDGAVRYADLIGSRTGTGAPIAAPGPLAGIIGLMAAAAPDRAVRPHAVVPLYIRRPDAELARLERARGSGQ